MDAASNKLSSPSRALGPQPLLPGLDAKVVTSVVVLLVGLYPILFENTFWTTVLATAGASSIAAIGLNLLTGYTGQVSLGHSAFLTIGGYVAAYFGTARGGWLFDWLPWWLGSSQGVKLIVWLPLAALAGAIVGGIIGPFALRVKGDYLVLISLALIFVVAHIAKNWKTVTGGADGISLGGADLTIGPLDFGNLHIFGLSFEREEGVYYLVWMVVGICALLARNIVRSRPGRAMQAVRDRDIAAEALGVNSAFFKITAFVLSSGMAATGGALLAVYNRSLSPQEPEIELFVSIQYVAIIVVGGIATIYGSIIGAALITIIPQIITEYTHWFDFTIPVLDRKLVSSNISDRLLFTEGLFGYLVFGLLLLLFLLLAPGGIAGWVRVARSWLLKYWRRLPAYCLRAASQPPRVRQ